MTNSNAERSSIPLETLINAIALAGYSVHNLFQRDAAASADGQGTWQANLRDAAHGYEWARAGSAGAALAQALRNAIDNIGAEKLSSNATLKAIIAELPRSALRKSAALKAALTPASRDVLDDL